MVNLKKSGSFIGVAGMATVGFLYFASGLLAPWWAVVLLCVFWFVMLLLSFRWFTPYPVRVFALPFVALVVWFVTLTFGDIVLGWTA